MRTYDIVQLDGGIPFAGFECTHMSGSCSEIRFEKAVWTGRAQAAPETEELPALSSLRNKNGALSSASIT